MPADPISSVLANEFKGPFKVVIAIAASVGALAFGVSTVEKFVDGRIDLKIASQQRTVDEHEKRLAKIEEQFSVMRDTLSDIHSDVKVLRAKMGPQ